MDGVFHRNRTRHRANIFASRRVSWSDRDYYGMLAGLSSYLLDDPAQHASALDITPTAFLNPGSRATSTKATMGTLVRPPH